MRETSMATIDGRRSRVRGVQRDATTHAGLWLDKYLTKVRLPDERKTREEGGEPDPGVAIRALLEEAGGNMSKAARMAGMDRMYLHRLVQKHGLRGQPGGGSMPPPFGL